MVIESLKSFTLVLAFNCMTKHPSQKVMNFRHLLSCDTIAAMHVMNEADEAYSIRAHGRVIGWTNFWH